MLLTVSDINTIRTFIVMIRYRVAIGILVCIVFIIYVRDREQRLRNQFSRHVGVGSDSLSSTKAFLLLKLSKSLELELLESN